jgi:hypothetical protein
MTTARAFLSRAEAAEYVQSHGLPLARGTLQKYATTGEGPRYHKFGQRCVYRREDLDAWITTKLGRPVTSSGNAAASDERDQETENAPERGARTRDPAEVTDSDR